MHLRDTYDAIAERWHEAACSAVKHRPGLEVLIRDVSSGARVLDVGCGTGLVARQLVLAGMHVTGIDFSEGMLQIARRECPEGRFLQMDLANIAEMDEVFDVVCAVAVLLHRPRAELVATLRVFGEKLTEKGRLYVAVKEKRPDRGDEEVVTEDHLGTRIERFFSFYTREEIEEAFTQAGFDVLFSDVVPSGRARWIEVVGRKRT
jgi:SAM-dependent methyltransferase